MGPVKPINYTLEFEPNLKDFTFLGKENIQIHCSKSVRKIILDAAELKIESCTVIHNGNIIKTKTKTDAKKEELVINLDKKINGKADVQIEFSGILNDRLLGFYRSQYKDKGKTKYLATTQFEAADARRAFPCWDQPEAKATFEISLITEKNHMAISNMPEVSKKNIGKKVWHKFSKTPIMSTYLIYLGVGEFEFLTSKIGRIDIRVVTTKGNKSRGKYALNLGKKLLRSYETYFGIKYPLPKLDLIAVPDFAAGAMENWGAITFRETILLYDPKNSSTRTKQYIAEVISHEIAHQWFGNLVTMKWWNDLWLNESFATFMATKFVDKFYPDWELWDQFLEDAMNVAMGIDALKSTHPIDVKVNSPSEIREIFDAISYDKGGCILRMLEDYVSETNFRKGLKKYLTLYKYKNAQGQDLWKAIGNVSNLPVNTLVKTWLEQEGFPLVEVEKKNSHLILSQSRFLMEPSKTKQKGLWTIPISLGKKKSKKLMYKKTLKIEHKSRNPLIINSGRTGFYRVKYEDNILERLKPVIRQKKISHVDRWAIQNDLFALCVKGKNSIKNYLDLSKVYYDEDNYLASVNVANNLNFVYLVTFFESFSNEIKEYSTKYLRKMLDRLGWDVKKHEKHTDSLFRSFVILALGKMNDKQVTAEAVTRFKKFKQRPESVNPDLREAIFAINAWNGTSKTFENLVTIYKKAKSQEEKMRVLGGMCFFQDEKLLIKTLEFSQSPQVRSQNMHVPIMRIAGNPYGKKILWPWIKQNWKSIKVKVGAGNPLLNRVVSSIGLFAEPSMEKEIRQFFKNNPTPGTERTLEQTLEKIRIKSRFLKNVQKDFS